jgi:4-amino-4-deoxy-L-arabinose transferase-like glycosyltransferase
LPVYPDWDYRQAILLGLVSMILGVYVYPNKSLGEIAWAAPRWRPYPLWPLSLLALFIMAYFTLSITLSLEVLGYKRVHVMEDMPGRDWQMLVYFGTLGLFLLGMLNGREAWVGWQKLGLERPWRHLHLARPWERPWLMEAGGVVLLTALALGIRLHQIDTAIPFFFVDETSFTIHHRLIADGQPYGMSQDIFMEQTNLGTFLGSYTIDIFGPTLWAARFLSALMGSLAIPGVYWAGRRLASPWAGTAAALFLIVHPVHLHFSRYAIYNIWDPTFGLYAVLLLWSGLEKGGRWKFALAGILIGIDQYFYTASRLWFVLLALWGGYLLLRQPRQVLAQWSHGLVLALGVLVAMLPLLGEIYTGGVEFSQRALDMSQGYGDSRVLWQVENWPAWLDPALAMFLDQGDRSQQYEMQAHSPFLLKWSLCLAGLGLAYALRYGGDKRVSLLVLWLGLTILLGGAAMHVVGFARYVILLPPLAILSGLGVELLARMLGKLLPAPVFPAVGLLVLGLVLLAGRENWQFYFEVQTPRFVREVGPETWVIATLPQQTAAVAKPENRIYWVAYPTIYPNGGVIHYWNPRVEGAYIYFYGRPVHELHRERVTPDWLQTLDRRQNLYIFIPPVPGDSPDPRLPPAPDSEFWVIQSVFPSAEYQRYGGLDYPATIPPLLYTEVFIPKQP